MTLSVVLEWTPTTNHVGLFVALARGWYADHDLRVEFHSSGRGRDDSLMDAARAVADGEYDLGVGPVESVVRHRAHPGRPDLRAVAAVSQDDTSGVAVLPDAGVDRPRELDGCRYASYGGRFESVLVETVVRADGGEGDVEFVHPEPLDVPGVLCRDQATATWVFTHWEGLLAERGGVSLRTFNFEEYGVPRGYTPVVFARPSPPEGVEAFLAAAEQGYRAAVADPQRAAADLAALAAGPHLNDYDFLAESVDQFADTLLVDDEWGTTTGDHWRRYVDWLRTAVDRVDEPLDPDAVTHNALFTDAYLPS